MECEVPIYMCITHIYINLYQIIYTICPLNIPSLQLRCMFTSFTAIWALPFPFWNCTEGEC